MHLIIDREKWLRGTTPSYLLHPRGGKQCCVGIYLSACGMADKDLHGESTADGLDELPPGTVWLKGAAGDVLYSTNDSRDIGPYDREVAIARLFAEQGVEVEFIN